MLHYHYYLLCHRRGAKGSSFFIGWWDQRLFIVVVTTKPPFVLGDSFLQNHWMWSKTLIGWSLSEMLSHTNMSSTHRIMNILLFSTGIDVLNLIYWFYKVALKQSLFLVALVGHKGNCTFKNLIKLSIFVQLGCIEFFLNRGSTRLY